LALTIYPEAHLVAVAASRLAAPPRPFVPAEPGGDAVAAAAYATAEAASKAAGVEDVHEVLLLAPPGFGLKYGMYRGLAGSLAAAAAAAAGGNGSTGAGASSLLPVASTGGAVNAAGAAGSAARAAVAVAAAAGWAGLPLWRQALLPGEEVAALK
jgi:cleavage and polyadenylation specificity factor subunit 1